jgi:hypothetical protein
MRIRGDDGEINQQLDEKRRMEGFDESLKLYSYLVSAI